MKPWYSGLWLLATAIALGSVPLFSLELGRYAIGALVVLSVFLTLPVHRSRKNWGATPTRSRGKS